MMTPTVSWSGSGNSWRFREKSAPPDQKLLEFIDSFRDVVDRKYKTLLGKFAITLTHPCREEETTLGNLVADILRECAECDVMLMGSGAIRSKELGPAVTLGDFRACFPFDDSLKRFTITGKQLRHLFPMSCARRTGMAKENVTK